eukprot:3828048-Amphidinium_carterae.1
MLLAGWGGPELQRSRWTSGLLARHILTPRIHIGDTVSWGDCYSLLRGSSDHAARAITTKCLRIKLQNNSAKAGFNKTTSVMVPCGDVEVGNIKSTCGLPKSVWSTYA